MNKLGHTLEAKIFLAAIRQEKRRSARDQFKLIEKLADDYKDDDLFRAITYCLENRLYSAVECRDAAEYFANEATVEKEVASTAPYRSCQNGSLYKPSSAV